MENKPGSGAKERVKAAARAVTTGDLTEMSSFARPPAAVKDTIQAVMFLLGWPVHQATDYRKGLAQLKAARTNGLVETIANREIQQVEMEAAVRARDALKTYTVEMIKNSSAATASLFNWANAMIEAVVSQVEAQAT